MQSINHAPRKLPSSAQPNQLASCLRSAHGYCSSVTTLDTCAVSHQRLSRRNRLLHVPPELPQTFSSRPVTKPWSVSCYPGACLATLERVLLPWSVSCYPGGCVLVCLMRRMPPSRGPLPSASLLDECSPKSRSKPGAALQVMPARLQYHQRRIARHTQHRVV
ncbi:hypothetical protein P153DRAFT_28108 [Dothidotthia symphoricarpi CBS 119687]|uniref:Uncharacterized protein n=1 Tax=Dothidotthia symphoricarpi CBS 119687 TaxID=1392245 RepID=A0A6A6AAR7_9PLEO|nr:uncharacterized protein P153DRAFT_28108 [Dothidotthia symphoricarpi CBS 119687]KAF2128910.1 hypothetical protein P153DRAFT_28108 [Dothidotthia symphoricarpi CBS 119687]